MDIEKLATSAVTGYISKTDYLSPFINEGDKEPSWDGNIYVFNNSSRSKCYLMGKVAVQVKGTYVGKPVLKTHYKYRVELSDLKNYEIHGVAYFVVYIDHEREPHIFYNLLHPVDIERILNRSVGKKGTNLEFKEVPSIHDITSVLINFIDDCNRQSSFVASPNFELLELDEIQFKQLSVSFSVSCNENKVSSLFKYMFSNEVFLYEKSPLAGYPDRPIDKVLIQAFSTNHNDNVSIDDEVFFTTFTSKYTKAFQEISFGQCISIIINQDNTYSYNVNLKGSIKEQIHTLEFLLKLSKSLSFNLGKIKLHINENCFDVLGMEEQYNYLQSILQVLNSLNVQEDLIIDYDNFDDCYESALSVLIKVIVNKLPYINSKWANIQRVNMRIFNLYLPLVFIKGLNGEPDRFVHELTQDVELTMQYKSKNIRMPQCILFSIRDYEYISSIYYDTIFNELTSYGSHEILDGRINQALLNMLSAFDKTCNKKLLDKAIELSEWIYSNCISLPMEIKLINKLQAIKRKRSLNMEELAELEVLSIQKNDAEVNTAIYLLLENVEKANIYYKQIEKKKAFKSFPIFKFMNKLAIY